MRPSTRVSHAALFLLLVGGVIWLGAVNIRALISNDMLKTIPARAEQRPLNA